MELDEFKNLSRPGKLSNQEAVTRPADTMEALISEIKSKDLERKKAVRIIIMSFVALAVIYITSVSWNKGLMQLGYLMLGGSFSLLIAYSLTKYLRMSKIDYAAPVARFLKDAEMRYRYWTLTDFIVSVPMLIVLCAGGGLIVYGSFQKYFPGSYVPLIIYLIVFGAALMVGLWAGRKQWKNQYGTIYDKIVNLKKEFEP